MERGVFVKHTLASPLERGVGFPPVAGSVPTLLRQDERLQFLHRLQKNRRQLRVVDRQEAVATLHDELRVDRLNLLRNDSDLTATLGLINPLVVDTADQIQFVQGTIQVHNVLLEARVRGAVERICHHDRIRVRRIQRGKACNRIVEDAELVNVSVKGSRHRGRGRLERIGRTRVGCASNGKECRGKSRHRQCDRRDKGAIQIDGHTACHIVGDDRLVPYARGQRGNTGTGGSQ